MDIRSHGHQHENDQQVGEAIRAIGHCQRSSSLWAPSCHRRGGPRADRGHGDGSECRKSQPLSDQHRAERLSFARAFQHWTVEQWSQVLFADETIFPNVYAGRQYCLRGVNEEMLPENLADKVAHPIQVNAWGCMSANGVGTLMTFEDTLNGSYMLKILKSCLLESRNKLFPDGQWHFMQDNARPHVDQKVERWLFDKHIPLIIMPPYSPDLNPIELLWSQLKPAVHRRFAKSADELAEAVIAEWNQVDVNYLRSIVARMPGLMQKVIAAKGGRVS